MNIILTDEQFNILREDIIKHIFSKNSEAIHSYMRVAKQSLLDSYEIRNLTKKYIPNELKDLVINKINTDELAASIEEKVIKHCQSKIDKLITRKINFNIEAKIQLEQENGK